MNDPQYKEAMRRLQWTDPLTGYSNRRYAMNMLQNHISEAMVRPLTVAVSFVDVDEFKRINDVFGHPAGDAVLREVARVLDYGYSKSCIVSRFGGDEFVVVSSGLTRNEVIDRAESTRRMANRHPLRVFETPEYPLAITVGVSFYPKDGRTPEQLLLAADKAAQRGKKMGGNRVVAA